MRFITSNLWITDITDLQTALDGKLSDITWLLTQWTNVTITGSGTSGSPYVISTSGWGGWGNYLSTQIFF